MSAILGCNTTTARALLIFFSWDAETVLGEPGGRAGATEGIYMLQSGAGWDCEQLCPSHPP